MGLNEIPSSERVHIGFFGKRNAGKSSLVNQVTGQELAVVSEVKGTTTDPVSKAMELLPMGPVVIIDTPGMDDEGQLGSLRVKKTREILNRVDVAVLVVDALSGKTDLDEELLGLFREKEIPWLVAYNKIDLLTEELRGTVAQGPEELGVSAREGWGIEALKERMAHLAGNSEPKSRLVGDLLEPGDFAVLVIPIDKAAPKGRLILPQQQTIRDILEAGAVAVTVKENELKEVLKNLNKKPKLVITDSQVFEKVSADTPRDIALTSFSILFARYKGDLQAAVTGAFLLDQLKDGDKILISEGCTHHRQCNDIGTVKLPSWIRKYTKKQLEFVFTSGRDFPEDLREYGLIVHCGACMLNEREMRHRIRQAAKQGVPMTNYGVLIAQMQGILKRCVEVFPEINTMESV